jgi:predicted flap endonuclease-1-like 5' DNA nuclease
VAWFIGQSTLVIVLAFGLGLVVGWLLWARRMRLLTVEIVAARIRAAEQAAARAPYGRRITWTSSGRIALDAHTPLGGDRRAPQSSATGRDEMGREFDDQYGEPEAADEAHRHEASAGRGGPHIPAPRIEPADISDRDELDFDGFDGLDGFDGADDLDDANDPARDDDLGTRFDPSSFPRLGHQRSTSDLRGLDRFRDLFTPSNGRMPRTPEPRRTEPELTATPDVNGDPSRPRRSVGDNADDTTLAAAGLAGDGAADASTSEQAGNRTPDSAGDADRSESADNAASATRAAATPGVDDARAIVDAAPAPDTVDDLTRIDGIGPKAAAALVAAGIHTFDHLAAADGDTVATALRASGVRLTSSAHAWPLAAHRLVARRIAEGAGDPGSAGGAMHTGFGHDRNGHDRNGHDPNALNGSGHDGGGHFGDANDRRGGLLPKRRSPGTPTRRSVPPDALDPDDLARIEGIGPKVAAALVASGIRTFGQLANADEMVLRKAIGSSRPNVAPSLPTWPTQARLLATGDENGFAELTARLIAGRGLDDDLERVDGIGPQTSAALRAAGIRTFRALAASDGNRLRAALENAGMRATPRIATWAAQARLLADGDEEGFADLAFRSSDGNDEGPA